MDNIIAHLLSGKISGNDHILPFLWLHGEPEETLREYMGVIHKANIGAVCVESRPHPDFLGAQWWHDLDIILDEAQKRGMKVWILDDSHFPTGYANGALQEADASLCRQSLVYRILTTAAEGEKVIVSREECEKVPDWQPNRAEQYNMDFSSLRKFTDDRFVGVVAVKLGGTAKEDILDLTGQVKSGSFTFAVPEGIWRIYAFNLTRNRGPHRAYINMMSKASCKVLLDTVYEAHWQHYKELFGKTIAGFFSDEPEIGNGHLYESGKRFWEVEDQAWSDEIEQELKTRLGEDFVRLLPLLWEQEFDGLLTAQARHIYMDTVSNAVKRDFSEQIGSWCRDHGVEYIGHLIEDNNQHLRCGSSLGHYFRGLSGQDMAGIDCIGGQVLPQGEWDGPYGLMGKPRSGLFYHYVLGKLGSSLAAIAPQKHGRCMCEIFGNYGWEEGVRLEKYLSDHFLVRGVNYFVPHAFSPKDFPDPDCPPHFYAHGHNPQYRHFGHLMAYIGRMSALFSGGHHDASVAILYNAEADWMGFSMALETVAQPLADGQVDYDFIPLDVFTHRDDWNTRIQNGLQVNTQHYRTLLIPGCDHLPGFAAEIIKELTENGCEVLFVGRKPENLEGTVINPSQIVDLVERTVRIAPENNRIRSMRYFGETERYLFVNEGTECYTGTISVPARGSCYIYNVWDNRIETVQAEDNENGTMLTVCIHPGKSLVVVFDKAETLASPVVCEGFCEDISRGWRRSICGSIDYPVFREDKLQDLPDTLAQEQPLFSGFVRYEKGISAGSGSSYVLEITDAYEGVEVFVNGRSCGIKIVPPMCYDLSQVLQPGKNTIAIEVATTLERHMSTQPDPIRQHLGLGDKQPACPSGISGSVKLWKK